MQQRNHNVYHHAAEYLLYSTSKHRKTEAGSRIDWPWARAEPNPLTAKHPHRPHIQEVIDHPRQGTCMATECLGCDLHLLRGPYADSYGHRLMGTEWLKLISI